jgi:hypothetical protein
MFIEKFNLKSTAIILSLLALLTSSEMFATAKACVDRRHHGNSVEAAQANYQDENSLIPVSDAPIPFSEKNFKTNFVVNSNKTVFEVQVPGLYSIDAFLLLNIPSIGDTVNGYITINGRKLLTFFESATRTAASPIVAFHFEDRLVYLKKGDQVSIVLSDFPPGTAVLARGFVMVALNNSR